MAALRVCMVVHEYFPRDFRVRRQARALSRAGLEVVVIALRQPGQPGRERLEGMEVIRLPVRRHRGKPLPVYLAEYLSFASLASATVFGLHVSRRFDVVQVHSPPDFLVATGLLAKLAGVGLVLDIHDLTPELYASRFKQAGGAPARWVLRAAERASCAVADRVLTVTEAFKRVLVSRGVAEGKVLVLLNCPDPEIFRPAPETVRPKQGSEFVIVHHGTLVYRYGVDVLLDAFLRVLPELPGARLKIYGEGDSLFKLRQRARGAAGADRIALYGEVTQEEIARALSSADLCVVPNRQDGFTDLLLPTKLLEALQMGCPVVASATRLVEETFSSGGVHLVPPGDPQALAEAILMLAKDEKARAKLAEEGRQVAKRFSWECEKEKLLDLYRSLGRRH